MSNVTTQQVSLSQKGLASYFQNFKVGKLSWKMDNGQVKTVITDSEEEFYGTADYTGFQKYWKLLMEHFRTNRITDTDKVFFTKNSKFPRTSFNRYSQKARRVEITRTATKYVINDKVEHRRSYYSRYIVDNTWAVDIEGWNTNHTQFENLIRSMSKSEARKAGSPIYKSWQNLTSSYWRDRGALRDALLFSLRTSFTTVSKDAAREVEFDSKPDRETFNFLMEGPDLNEVVTDSEANRYVDTFKPKLDADNFKILWTALSNGDSNITMGMKLLENMDVNNGVPYLYALFIGAFSVNGANIRRNKLFHSTGVKNMRVTYELDKYLTDEYSYTDRIAQMQEIYDKRMKTDAEKALYKKLIKEPMNQALLSMLGKGPYTFLVNVNAEENELCNNVPA